MENVSKKMGTWQESGGVEAENKLKTFKLERKLKKIKTVGKALHKN
jgi:hypothetical protein